MPTRDDELKEGYHIFFSICLDDKGFEMVARGLEEKIKEAEIDWDITFLSGATYRDDPAGRSIFFAAQSAILANKKAEISKKEHGKVK